MNSDIYYGNQNQIRGVEEYELKTGKAKTLSMMQVRNGLGLVIDICIDRCADITRVTFKGDNLSYFSTAGYASPTYYDSREAEMVRSFTGGFLTTCGLDNVGTPCNVDGINYPLHGRISNQPAMHSFWDEDDNNFIVYAKMSYGGLGLGNLILERNIYISKKENKIELKDKITNNGRKTEPVMILYHMNMGYPLLSENSILDIKSNKIIPRNDFAKEHINKWNIIEKPGSMEEETCYFHEFENEGYAKIYNPDIKKGVIISFDANNLKHFTQWKLMDKYDYVLGLEPGNTLPNGREQNIKNGDVKFLKEKESVTYKINVDFKEE